MNAKELGAQMVAPKFTAFGDKQLSEGGLTKRELFAKEIFVKIILSSTPPTVSIAKGIGAIEVELAVLLADRLLAELAKEQP